MYLPFSTPRNRIREAENARENRAEIVKALSTGDVSRRDLFKWGIFTTTGALAFKNGLSPYASSAYGQVPTGVPATPLFGAIPYTQPLPRLNLQSPQPLSYDTLPNNVPCYTWPEEANQLPCKRLSWHTEFTASNGADYINPKTGRGPVEGRPPGEWFGHQRYDDHMSKVGYLMSIGKVKRNTKFHPLMPSQHPNSIWTFGSGGLNTRGVLPPPLIKMRYGESAIVRIYNSLPNNRSNNNGFGRNEPSIHNHNAHNGSASDGASNAHFFPGQFYDYHWGTTLARADMINQGATVAKASGPDGTGGLTTVPGDFRELQNTLWFHDHRFFFTAENVYKGFAGMLNYYSGPDRGREVDRDADTADTRQVNLRLPSGNQLDWGNIDFDVNLMIADWATDQDGNYFFDIFNTDGFLGDRLHVNFAYAPYFEVLPRKYRFRILNACMSRWLKLALLTPQNQRVPFWLIANDGNFLVNPVPQIATDVMGSAERYDIIVDFSQLSPGDSLELVNTMAHSDGRGPDRQTSIPDMRAGDNRGDTAVGPVMQFRVVNQVQSVDNPDHTHHAGDPDHSQVPTVLTEQIPIVDPVRTRHFEWTRGSGDSRDTPNGKCIPDCGDREDFPWTVRINGENAHSLNANRISSLIPRPGEVEHWTMENGGGGWDHPIHLHFEEGITMNRGNAPVGPHEHLARKDVWKLGEGGKVTFQVQFGEFGGAYVNHCHNTVHEDFAMLTRFDVLTEDGQHVTVPPTPKPTKKGVKWLTPEILPEGDPSNPQFFQNQTYNRALAAKTKKA